MRLLKFIGAFLGAALFIFIIVIAVNWDAYKTIFENQSGWSEGSEWVQKTYSLKGLTQYVGANPAKVSVVSYKISQPDSGIYYGADKPRVMGATGNLLLAIEYARQTDAGMLNRREEIPVSEIEKYQLPSVNEATHKDALDQLREESRISKQNTIKLEDLVATMVEFNDLPMADYLFFRLGANRISALLDTLALKKTNLPVPFSGLYIEVKPALYNLSFEQRMEQLSSISTKERIHFAVTAARKYADNQTYRKKIRKAFEDEGLDLLFTHQRDAFNFFPKTTAREMAGLMYRAARGELINPAVSRHIIKLMSWPMDEKRMHTDFTQYSGIYDERMGLLAGVDLGTSKYSGDAYAQAVLFDDLPIAFWFHMSSNHMLQDYQQRLIWDPALQSATRYAITAPDDSLDIPREARRDESGS